MHEMAFCPWKHAMALQFPAAFGVSVKAIAFAINVFDRYLCAKNVIKADLQLCASKRA